MYRILLLTLLLSGCQHLSEKNKSIIKFNIEGKWDWSISKTKCEKTWHLIRRSDNQLVFQNSSEFEQATGEFSAFYRYEILDEHQNGYHLALKSEQRTGETGKPVTWYLLFEDENSYRWRRSDWALDERTGYVERCI